MVPVNISFLIRWLDKLGLAAVVNHTVVLRQDFIGGNYALLDSSANPVPVSLIVCVCVCVCVYVCVCACVHACMVDV